MPVVGCAQKEDVSRSNDLTVKFEHPATRGTTKIFLVDGKAVPKSVPLPNGYTLIDGRIYQVSTDVIDLGSPTVIAKLPSMSKAEFEQVRILRIIPEETEPAGYTWSDCTISLSSALEWQDRDPQFREADFESQYRERYAGSFPDFAAKTVSCSKDFRWMPDEYIAITRQAKLLPTKRFTDILIRLVSIDTSSPGQTSYQIVVENRGPKDAAQVNLATTFDVNASVISIKTTAGRCQSRPPGYSGDVCHLGPLKAGDSITINFVAAPSGMEGSYDPAPFNFNWEIDAFFKEHDRDLVWPVNVTRFQPLRAAAEKRSH